MGGGFGRARADRPRTGRPASGRPVKSASRVDVRHWAAGGRGGLTFERLGRGRAWPRPRSPHPSTMPASGAGYEAEAVEAVRLSAEKRCHRGRGNPALERSEGPLTGVAKGPSLRFSAGITPRAMTPN